MKRLVFFIFILAASVSRVNAQFVAIKTDVVSNLCHVPNLNAEFVVSNHISLNATVQYAYHSFGTNLRSFSLMPEVRYWYGGRPMTNLFVGLSGVIGSYQNPSDDYRMDEKSYRGQVMGAGLTFGYVWGLGHSKRWLMEVHGGLGLYYYDQKSRYESEYQNGQFVGNAPHKESGLSLLPYKLGISFAYILPVEKKKK